MKYKVQVSQEWKEFGEVEIEADSEEEAKEKANEMLSDGNTDIDWHGSDMDPGGHCVETVTLMEEDDEKEA